MMKIAIDLDNTLNSSKTSIEFFSVLSHLLIANYSIYIITDREPNTEQNIADELDYLGIEYSEIVITSKKAEFIRQQGINIFFENQDEFFIELGSETTVFKIREDGNFDFAEKKWIGSHKTTKMID
jgi:hypothetical protein